MVSFLLFQKPIETLVWRKITEIVTTDTVHIPSEKRHPILHVLSVAHVFGEAIRRNYLRQSIGDLFVFGEESP